MRCTVPRQTNPQEGTMKLLLFDDFKLGVLKGDAVVDVSDAVKDIPHTGPHNLISGLIERFADYKGRLEGAVARGAGKPLSQVRVRPPLPKPYNIVAMAVNYMEDGTRSEPAPINAFHKSPNSVIGDGDIIATGTNHRGLSGFQNGDRIEIETDGLGRLRFNIRDDLKRTWGRETRLDRQEKKQEGTTPQLTGKYTPVPR